MSILIQFNIIRMMIKGLFSDFLFSDDTCTIDSLNICRACVCGPACVLEFLHRFSDLYFDFGTQYPSLSIIYYSFFKTTVYNLYQLPVYF